MCVVLLHFYTGGGVLFAAAAGGLSNFNTDILPVNNTLTYVYVVIKKIIIIS